MNERIEQLARQVEACYIPRYDMWQMDSETMKKFAELIVQEYASKYNKLINGEAVVLPKDREHAEALVRVGMFYLENNK